MRVGSLKSVAVPLAKIARLRTAWDAAVLKERSMRNLALLSYPNVVVDLKEPLAGPRGTLSVAHRLDDPVTFPRALTARLG